MSITYIEKGPGLHDAIRAAGYILAQVNGVWTSTNDTAVQAIINSYVQLPDQKVERIALIKADGLARMNVVFPAIVSVDQVAWDAEQWLSIAPAARSPTTNFQTIINIYTAAKNAIAAVNACTTKAQIDAVAVSWPP